MKRQADSDVGGSSDRQAGAAFMMESVTSMSEEWSDIIQRMEAQLIPFRELHFESKHLLGSLRYFEVMVKAMLISGGDCVDSAVLGLQGRLVAEAHGLMFGDHVGDDEVRKAVGHLKLCSNRLCHAATLMEKLSLIHI